MDVTVIVATFGDDGWLLTGNDTSHIVTKVFQVPVVRVHGGTLASARNAGASLASSEWLCFLDAGDMLDANYFKEMEKSSAELRAPRLFFQESLKAPYEPYDLRLRNMEYGNPCAIGTLITKSVFEAADGFWEERAYEDWSLFRRAWLLGASVGHTDAKYCSTQVPGVKSRNDVDNPQLLIKEITDSHERWLRDYSFNHD